MCKDWVHEEQLMPLVELLAQFCGYDFGEEDSDAVFCGIKETDYENDIWFEYPIAGHTKADLRLSQDIGTDVVFFELCSIIEIESKIETAQHVFNHLRTRQSSQQGAKGDA